MRTGPREIVAILAVVLLIFGPSMLPGLAKASGKSVNELKEWLRGKGTREAEEASSDSEK